MAADNPNDSSGPTRTSPEPPPPPSPMPRHGGDAERFLPGTVLAGRYRMIGLLGRGGMGEVYRADDLKLGQPVALKFLPRAVEQDPERLERFINEVRLSLRVTHPNVCRVFDVAQADGRHYLSMEYVDGEDLSSLLRRIGHLPEDKAVQIARQLCAGLAAAHEEGVLHRDLKPANVMIDGRGRAKITDFGLAGATAGIKGLEARAGTPQYMAPEQAAGGELSERTDVYALGLVLYELFTGKRALDAKDVEDPSRRRPSTPTSPSAHLRGLDPAVERAILRCLETDPARRPPSAAAVAAALPGGDPLAMALAAGETPSPEMVAHAGGRGELSPAVASTCLAVVLIGLLATWFLMGRTALENRVPMPTPPGELAVAARAIATAAGHPTRARHTAHGFGRVQAYFNKVMREDRSPGRWDSLPRVRPSPLRFWYRESPAPLTPSNDVGRVDAADPPLLDPGMIRVYLDPDGALQEFRAVPPDTPEPAQTWPEPDWKPLLTATKLDAPALAAADPQWTPPFATDVRRAWTSGSHRIEACGFRGRIVWFTVIPSWRLTREGTVPPPAPPVNPVGSLIQSALIVIGMVAGVLLARRNIKLGRGDRQGASRFAIVYATVGFLSDVLTFSNITGSFAHMMNSLGLQVFYGALAWVFYVAIEPYVRRLWPDTLTAWTRILEGRFRDPLVGRHILIGAMVGLAVTAILHLDTIAAPLLGTPPSQPRGAVTALAGGRFVLSEALSILQSSIFAPVVFLLFMLVLRVLLRRPLFVYTAIVAIAVVTSPMRTAGETVGALVLAILIVAVLTRLGLLALLVMIVFSTWEHHPLTTDANSWFFPWSVMTMAAFAAVAVYAFVISLSGKLPFTVAALEE
jgi:hypothetical protein